MIGLAVSVARKGTSAYSAHALEALSSLVVKARQLAAALNPRRRPRDLWGPRRAATRAWSTAVKEVGAARG